MEARLVGQEDRGIVVRVRDREGHEHVVVFEHDGSVLQHMQGRFPADVDGDGAPARILRRVQRRARYEAHRGTDADLLDPLWNPDVAADAAAVLTALDADEFAERFGEFHTALGAPLGEEGDEGVEGDPEGAGGRVAAGDDGAGGTDGDRAGGTDGAAGTDADRGRPVDTDDDGTEGADADGGDGAAGTDADGGRPVDTDDDGTDGDGVAGADWEAPEVLLTAVWLRLNRSRDRLLGVSPPVTVAVDRAALAPAEDDRFEYVVEEGDLAVTDVGIGWDPDVQVALPAMDAVPPLDGRFRALLVHHLRCRVRDLYYLQGRRPPEPYRVEGPGIADHKVVPYEDQET